MDCGVPEQVSDEGAACHKEQLPDELMTGVGKQLFTLQNSLKIEEYQYRSVPFHGQGS